MGIITQANMYLLSWPPKALSLKGNAPRISLPKSIIASNFEKCSFPKIMYLLDTTKENIFPLLNILLNDQNSFLPDP